MRTSLFINCILAFTLTISSIYSQNFTEETNTPFMGVNGLKSIQLGDVDDDGDLDLIGISGGTTARLFKNNGVGTYIEEQNGFINDPVENIRFVDIEGDNDLDVFVIRNISTTGIDRVYDIYENNGVGGFTKHQISGITTNFNNVNSALQFAFGDVDGDNDMDMTISGLTTQFSAKIWRYDGNYTYSQLFSGILQAVDGKTEFADLDNDGDQDLLVIGQNLNGAVYHKYFNSGTGTFTLGNVDSLEGAFFGDFDLGDVDGDGDLDAVQVGSNRSTGVMATHRNNGAGHYSSYFGVPAANYTVFSTVKFADFDNDGDLDIVGACMSATPDMNIFLNLGTGQLSPMNGQPFGTVNFRPEIQVGDIDGDTDMDIVLTYQISGVNMYTTKIFKNNIATLSIKENVIENIALYPNPTNSILNIKTSLVIKEVSIYSLLGEPLFKTKLKTIDVSNLQDGLYILKVETENKLSQAFQFIKH
ncbi:FG-GAP-like repeat-containing protein [Pontimicrobium sp. MEBiC06410]